MMRSKRGHSSYHIELDNHGLLARRRTELLPGGAYLFEDQLDIPGDLAVTVIMCAAWLLELYELQLGEILFLRGKEKIRPRTQRFGVFYPPFSLAQPCFKNAKGYLVGIASMEAATALSTPVLFDAAFDKAPTSVAQAIGILNAGNNLQPVEMNPVPSLISIKAKNLIDESYGVYPSIARIAGRLGVSHEHLSRHFKRDFGMSPSDYLRRLRVADVPLRLAKGEEIIEVSQHVGYNDLSRFYKQFRKTTNTSPGACKAIMRPQRR